eukprot:GHVS01010275.1.p1 GENE.GHVS01010275.1~~GHVS01010275.1.p1  ORF type:complete len:202 (-),score=6.94 GHVS01010275.1:51-656(-)
MATVGSLANPESGSQSRLLTYTSSVADPCIPASSTGPSAFKVYPHSPVTPPLLPHYMSYAKPLDISTPYPAMPHMYAARGMIGGQPIPPSAGRLEEHKLALTNYPFTSASSQSGPVGPAHWSTGIPSLAPPSPASCGPSLNSSNASSAGDRGDRCTTRVIGQIHYEGKFKNYFDTIHLGQISDLSKLPVLSQRWYSHSTNG